MINNVNDHLSQIEHLTGVEFPTVFKDAVAQGLMDYGIAGRDWKEKSLPLLREHPPLLLYAKDFEPISMEVAVDAINNFADPNFHMGNYTEFGLLPFAGSGAGDVYCFLHKSPIEIDCGECNEIPVVIAYHDAPEIDVLAKNFQDFVFTQMLSSVSGFLSNDRITTGSLEDNLRNMLRSHRPVLTERQYQVLDDVFRHGIVNFHLNIVNTKEPWELISPDETEAILEREIGFPYRNYTFFIE